MAHYKQWLGAKQVRPDGSEVTVVTKWAVLEVGAEKKLALDVKSVLSNSSKVMLVFDRRVGEIAERVRRALSDQGISTMDYLIPDGKDGEPPCADDKQVVALQKHLVYYSIDWVVAVGAGTNNDIAKYACTQQNKPYVVYGTASSMNGYNSGIAALYVGGLKSTLSCNPPIGMYADPEVLAKAPLEMTLAGLGDLCSKPFAGADAAIASIIQEQPLWRLPAEMVEESFEEALANAEKIGKGDIQAVASLMEALWVSGFSMVLAGSSAPASGGEHLWSHRLDMARHDQDLPIQALHGTQVGVACNLVRPLFHKVSQLEFTDVKAALERTSSTPSIDSKLFEQWMKIRHKELSRASRGKVVEEAKRKYEPHAQKHFEAGLLKHWEAIRAELDRAKHHADRIEVALKKAKAPCAPSQIGVEISSADHLLTVSRDIRNRQTILDLVANLLGEEHFVVSEEIEKRNE